MNRAGFLAGTGAFVCAPLSAQAKDAQTATRALWLRRSATGEEGIIPFTLDGRRVYLPGYRRICWLLRDTHVEPQRGFVAFSIDTIEALWEIQGVLRAQGMQAPLIITSAYRTPETNASIENAARDSQHLHATAVDMYVDGISMSRLFEDCASRAISGGMGYYDDHIHLDTGPRRFWSG